MEVHNSQTTTLWEWIEAGPHRVATLYYIFQHSSILAQTPQCFFLSILKALSFSCMDALLWSLIFLVSSLDRETSDRTCDYSIHVMLVSTVRDTVASTAIGPRLAFAKLKKQKHYVSGELKYTES